MGEIQRIKKAFRKLERQYDKAKGAKERNRIVKKGEALQNRLDQLVDPKA